MKARGSARRILHALAAVAAIGALVGGPPYALLRYVGAPLPSGWAGLAHGQLDDQALVGLLSLVVWAAWAQFTVCILLEVIAGVRGIGLPRRPALAFAFQQELARVLVTPLLTLAIGATTAGIQSAPASAAPTAVQPATEITTSMAPIVGKSTVDSPHASRASPTPAGYRTYVVQPPNGRSRDSLWRIAATHLGNGERWNEIYALNRGRLMPDGRRLTTPGLILPGWVLSLPADAIGLEPPTDHHAAPEVTVQPGDTLSKIAAERYGDAGRYPQIFAANQGRHEPDGRTVSDPDVIYPGWQLTLPLPASTPRTPHPPRPPASPPSPSTPRHPSTPEVPPAPQQPTSLPITPSPGQQSPSSATSPERIDTNTPTSETLRAVFAGIGALLAAGLLTTLVRLQRRRSRHRRPGRAIATTPPELADDEKAIRSLGSPALPDVEFIDHALRSLANATTRDPGVALPDIVAARLTSDHLDLRLAHPHPTAPPTPWTGDESGYWWSIARTNVPPLPDDTPVAPYPALVGIGHTGDNRWLLDLEQVPTLSITGPVDACLSFARFLAAELAVNSWSDHVRAAVVGFGAELADLNPARLHHAEDAERLAEGLLGDLAQDATADVLAQRADEAATELRPPQVLLIAPRVAGAALTRLTTALSEAQRRTAITVVRIDDEDQPSAARRHLVLDGNGHLTIADLDITVVGQQLPADQAAGIAALLHAARDTTDHPMPPNPGNPYSDAAGGLRPEHTTPRPPHPDQPATESVLPEPDTAYLDQAATTTEDLALLAPRVNVETRHAIEAADPDLDADLAAWRDPNCPLPRLTLLGPVQLRARGDQAQVTRRIGYYTEVITYLATRPHGATADQVAEAFGIKPGRVRTDIYLARKWLGTNPRTGKPHLPNAPQAQPARGVSVYQIEDILIDADLFRRLRMRGQARGAAGIADLQAALDLVTGQPLDQLRPGGYTWLADNPLDHYYTAAIVDVAHLLTTHYLAQAQADEAQAAAETALRAAPHEETPRLDLAAALHALGDADAASRLVREAVIHRGDDGVAPEDLPTRSAAIVHRHKWLG
jgi:nucleoid-associated protein YgaU